MSTVLLRHLFGIVLVLLSLGVVVPSSKAQQCTSNIPHIDGEWRTLPYLMPINPISATLLHTGQILIVAGSENDASNNSPGAESYRNALWDPTGTTQNSITVQNIDYDVFCSGTAALPDGRALVVGGTSDYSFTGDNRASIFDPATGRFVQSQSMVDGRWYATATTLSDGRIMTFSGLNETTGGTNNTVEIYDLQNAGAGWTSPVTAPFTPALYPPMFLLPNGKVFHNGQGSGQIANAWIFDLTSKTWTRSVATTRDRHYGSAVLLPLLPPSYTPKVMNFGGGSPATNTTEIIDLSASSPSWTPGPNMSTGRIEMNAVILPNGKVLAEGGSVNNEAPDTPGKKADLYDPLTNTFSSGGAASYSRLYHSVALLLPDATVVSMGSNPGSRGDYEPSIEIYTPAYLFDANDRLITTNRPSILSVSSGVMGYNAPFSVTYTSASAIGSAVLIRLGSTTHTFDMDQRLISLCGPSPQPACTGSGTLSLTSPPNSNIAPPGYYMLFLLDSVGVPSKAQFVQLSPYTTVPPRSAIASPASDVTIQAGGAVSFSTTSTAAKYSWVFPGGFPATSTAQTPGNVVFNAPGTYVVSLTVIDTAGNSDPSPPTRTITVLPQTADFSITVSPSSKAVIPGQSTTFTVTVSPLSGFNGAVSLSVGSESGFPSGITSGGFSPSAITGAGSSTLTMNTTSSTTPTALSLTITGTAGTLAHTASTTLLVNLAAPTSLTATPGNAQVLLSWPVSIGATSYHVKRATVSGGPYVTVGCATTTSYTDTGLSNSTTYYYVVSAAYVAGPNAGGESPNSSEASATPQGSITAPIVTSVTPATGPTSGGTSVTITGTNFATTGGVTASFGGTAATNVVVSSSTSLTATTPAHAAGAVNVTVTNPDAQSGTLPNGFTYTSTTQAISFVQVAAATPQSSPQTVTVTYPSAQTTGDLNIVVVGWNDTTATVQSVRDSVGNTYSLAIGPTSGTGLRQSIYYAANIGGGSSNTVTVTFSQPAAYPDIRILEYRGVTTLDVTAAATGSSSTANSGSATTTAANELIFGANTVFTGATGPGTGFTSRIITSPDSDIAEDQIVTTTGSYSASAPLSSAGPWVMQMAMFKPGVATSAPTVSSVTPATGPVSGGTSVTVTGTNFVTGATVSFGGTGATNVTVVNSTSLTATTAAHAAGVVNVVVTNPDTQSGILTNGFTYAPAPTVGSVSPNSGPASGGTSVTVTGTNFVTGATVSFGGTGATNVTVVNGTSLTATTPAHAAGAVNVTVTNPDTQSGTLPSGFTYTTAPIVTSVTPATGPVSGGTSVTVTGTNFATTGGVTASFGGTAATNVVVSSSTSLTATTPAHAAGAVNVTVTNPDAQSGTLPNGFTYDATPPVLSNGQPTGTLPAGTTQTTISLTTDENATCKYATTAGTPYASMPNTFAVTGGVSHSTTVSGLANGQTYSYYCRCSDIVGNVDGSDYVITFSIASTPPVISFVQVAAATPQAPTATVAVTYPSAQTAGDLNIVVVGWNDTTASVQSVTDSAGKTYSLAIGPTSGTGLRQALYYLANITGGSKTVTVTFSQPAAYPDIRILEYRGVTTLDVTAAATGSSSTANSGSATTTAANELIFGANTVVASTKGAGSGFTSRIITSLDSDIAEDRIVTTTGSYGSTAPLTGTKPWVMQMATFK